MAIGRLRTRVAVQEAVEVETDSGAIERTWRTRFYRWAQVRPLRADEFVQAQQIQAQITHRVSMRADDVRTSDRLLLPAGRVLHIEGVFSADGERGFMMSLWCREDGR